MITVIAPHARPEFAANLRANFEQQGADCRLVVVENGPAVGTWQPSERVTVLRSDAHQADAMNMGLAWLRENGNGPWARFDDDDHYGCAYLADTEALLASSRADVVGKPWAFVLHDEGLFRFLSPAGTPFTGGTLAARSADVLPFERRSDDDVDWCERMRAQGARLQPGKAWDYCYDRRSRDAARVIEGGLFDSRFAWGACWAYGSLGPEAVEDRWLVPVTFMQAPSEDEIRAHLVAP